MKTISKFLFAFALASLPALSAADPWKDESGHGKGHGHGRDRHDYKDEYWDGHCKVERKLERNGEYKEERKCQLPRNVYHGNAPYPGVVKPGVTIHGSIHIPY